MVRWLDDHIYWFHGDYYILMMYIWYIWYICNPTWESRRENQAIQGPFFAASTRGTLSHVWHFSPVQWLETCHQPGANLEVAFRGEYNEEHHLPQVLLSRTILVQEPDTGGLTPPFLTRNPSN